MPNSAASASGLLHLLQLRRENIGGKKAAVRLVYKSEILRNGPHFTLDKYISDRAPLFYRRLSSIIKDMQAGYFLSAINNTLAKLPTSKSFQISHFGEIVAAIFAEEVLGLRRLYSKLTLLSAENANAYKMDLVYYDPSADPIELVFGEVKCSPKSAKEGLPAKHDDSCFADIFASMNKYSDSDKEFDLTAVRDHLNEIPDPDRQRVREALKPYSEAPVRYAAFAIIDVSTYSETEAQVLRTRKNYKAFDVDIVCLESYAPVAENVYGSLKNVLVEIARD